MTSHQPGITADVPSAARYLTLQLAPEVSPGDALATLASQALGDATVVGIGPATVARLGRAVEGLREPTCLQGTGVSVPADPAALWCWLRGSDRGELLHRSNHVVDALAGAFVLDAVTDAFMHDGGRDLTGYEDGTENPTGDEALAAAFLAGAGPGLDGSSFVAVQKWVHDLRRFQGFPETERDAIIGRRHSDNEEIEDAPVSAHVKRTAQESFSPEAFVLRRSMPWADSSGEGLVFVAFGHSFQAFEAQLRRMVGIDDQILDGLFRFTRPVATSYFWCPPVQDGRLDLRALLAGTRGP